MDEQAKRIEELEIALKAQQEQNDLYRASLKQKDELIAQASELANHFATGKLMKINHLFYRISGQLIHGKATDRKEFWSWLFGKAKNTNRTLGEGRKYNPWMVLDGKLQEALRCTPKGGTDLSGFRPAFSDSMSESGSDAWLPALPLEQSIAEELDQDYTQYDVIMLSVIDYHFRHQRPQHFAVRFAANGHRVFYVNANFIRKDSVSEIADKLYEVDFSSTEHNAIYTMQGEDTLGWMKEKLDALIYSKAIRDAVVVVDYPNWVYGAEYLRKQYGFQIVTDYMDDFTGFLGTAEEFLKDNCIRLLQTSDLVVTSSTFLHDVAARYASKDKITVIRNGTETDHFYQAVNMQIEKRERKVIGYYGAVAHWFAWEKVCYLAEHLPECDIVIIGEVTEHGEKLSQYSNIKLLGEKQYTSLPEHLAYFDVCLIPFDTSTDLIKATNPVKFYEYLSAGKKIVATEIPELEPFRDQYVYMANEDEAFLQYVKACLDGKDTLADAESCIAFARENDWQKRYEAFEEACRKTVPRVSVIVLTYNNLDYNKRCINSILTQTAYADYELIVVDNFSVDGTREYLQELAGKGYPNVHIVLNDENKGFAGGNNQGMKIATGEYVLLLNNDTVVSRGWIQGLVKHMRNDEKLGMCGSVTNSIGNEAKIRAQYTDEHGMREFAHAYTSAHMGEEYRDVDRLAMFCTLIRDSIIREYGGLDDGYRIGMFEDDDYARVVMDAGYRLAVAEDSFIHHINNGSFNKLEDAEYKKIFEENKKRFEKKWNTTWKMPKYREGVTADCNLGVKL